MSRQLLDLPTGPIEAWRSGDGPTVLVSHGCGYGGSYRNSTWLAKELPDHQVVSISRPGYGETPLSTAPTFHEQAAMYLDVLDAIGVASCVVVGMSASGPIALLAARDHAPRIRGLVLWCAVARGLPSHRLEEDTQVDTAVLEGEKVAELGMYTRALADASFCREMLPGLFTPTELARYDADPQLRATLRTYLEDHLVALPAVEGVRNDMLQLTSLLDEGVDARVDVPTLIMHGSNDATVPADHARYHAAQNPSAELEVIEGAGHGFMLTFRPRVVAGLRPFLAKCAVAGGDR